VQAGPIFRKRLALAEGPLTTTMVRRAPRWRKMENTVKSFLGNSLHLLCEPCLSPPPTPPSEVLNYLLPGRISILQASFVRCY
jgi:hypothetical protein